MSDVTTYFESVENPDIEKARKLLEARTQAKFPEVDTRPGTVFGDVILSPEAEVKARSDQALQNMLSDMSLDNLRNGRVNNTEFAKSFLENFGDFESSTMGGYGYIRLVVSTESAPDGSPWVLPDYTRFRFNSPTADHEFRISLPRTGDLYLIPASFSTSNTALYADNNTIRLVKDDDLYVAYLPVSGATAEQILEGDSAYSSPKIDFAVSMQAASNIQTGRVEDTVEDYARLIQQSLFTASLSSRKGAVSYTAHKIPDALQISAVITGDVEMTRGQPTSGDDRLPCVDLFVRAPSFTRKKFTTTLYEENGVLSGALPIEDEAIVSFVSLGQRLDDGSITYADMDDVIVTMSSTRETDPGGSGGLSGNESIYLSINTSSTSFVETSTDRYDNVEVVVELDPAVENLRRRIIATDAVPVGVSLDVKPFPVIRIKAMRVVYTPVPGVALALDDAKTELVRQIRTYGYYYQYSAAAIENILKAAGIAQVISVRYDTQIIGYPINKCLPVNTYVPPGILTALSENVTPILAGASTKFTNVVDPSLPSETFDLGANIILGKRNTAFYITEEDIQFEEIV